MTPRLLATDVELSQIIPGLYRDHLYPGFNYLREHHHEAAYTMQRVRWCIDDTLQDTNNAGQASIKDCIIELHPALGLANHSREYWALEFRDTFIHELCHILQAKHFCKNKEDWHGTSWTWLMVNVFNCEPHIQVPEIRRGLYEDWR